MSSALAEAPRRSLTDKQAETVQKLTDAAIAELRHASFDAMTVRTVAKRAGVAPATAYTYFASKEHLVTEAFWRTLQSLPEPRVTAKRTATRVMQAFAEMSELFVEMPELVSACTIAMVADDPEVRNLRDRVGHEIHRRFVAALPKADPATIEALDFAMSGALLRAGTGHMSHADVPGKIAEIANLLTQMTRHRTTLRYSPYDYEIHEDPYPTYARLRAEAPALPQRRARLLGALPPRRRRPRRSATPATLLVRARRVARAGRDRPARVPDDVVPRDGPAAPRPHARARVARASRRAASPTLEPRIRDAHAARTSSRRSTGRTFDFVARLLRDAADGRDLRDDRRARSATATRCGGSPTCSSIARRASSTCRRPAHGGRARARRLLRRHARRAARAARPTTSRRALLDAELDGDRLTTTRSSAFLFLMVVAGNETTAKLLANAWYWAWRNPDQRAKASATGPRPGLGRGDAALRHVDADAGAHADRRTSSCTARRIPAGDRVLLLVGSANRDEDVFPHADRYDLDRDTSASIGFGVGPPLLPGRRARAARGAGSRSRSSSRACRLRHRRERHHARALGERPRASSSPVRPTRRSAR